MFPQSSRSSCLYTHYILSGGNRNTESLTASQKKKKYLIAYSGLSGRFRRSFVLTVSGPFVIVKPCQKAATLCCLL